MNKFQEMKIKSTYRKLNQIYKSLENCLQAIEDTLSGVDPIIRLALMTDAETSGIGDYPLVEEMYRLMNLGKEFEKIQEKKLKKIKKK